MTKAMFMMLADIGQGLFICAGGIATIAVFYMGLQALRKKLR